MRRRPTNAPTRNWRCALSAIAACAATVVFACSKPNAPAGPSASTPASALYTLSGRVTDRETSLGISGAEVRINDANNVNFGRITTTDGNGGFTLAGLARSGFTVRFAATGYTPLNLSYTLTEDIQTEARLEKLPPPTRTVTGVVTDETSRGVLPNVSIASLADGVSTVTDASGSYRLEGVSSSARVLTASATSYLARTATAPEGGAARVDFIMVRDTNPRGSVVTFSGIGNHLSGVGTYTESGVTISATEGRWLNVRNSGNPAPAIEMQPPLGGPRFGTIEISAGGTPFRFRGVEYTASRLFVSMQYIGLRGGRQFYFDSFLLDLTSQFRSLGNRYADYAVDSFQLRIIGVEGATYGIDNIWVEF